MMDLTYDFLLNFLVDFSLSMGNINSPDIPMFLMNYKYMILFLFITYMLILFDPSFSTASKFKIFLFIMIFLFLLRVYEYNDLNWFFSELYWYMLMLNLSFLIHGCWFHWIYTFFWNFKCEKICWVMSSMAFMFSLSFLVFLMNCLYCYLTVMGEKNADFFYSWSYLYYMYFFFWKSLLILAMVISFFMMMFATYTDMILGNKNLMKMEWSYMLMAIMYLVFSFILSYWMLGVSSFMLSWLFLFLFWFCKIIYDYYQEYKIFFPDNMEWKEILIKLFFLEIDSFIWLKFEIYQMKKLITVDDLYSKNYKETLSLPNESVILLTKVHKFIWDEYMSSMFYHVFFGRSKWVDLARANFHYGSLGYVEDIYYLKLEEAIAYILKLKVNYNLSDEEFTDLLNFYHLMKPSKLDLMNKGTALNNI